MRSKSILLFFLYFLLFISAISLTAQSISTNFFEITEEEGLPAAQILEGLQSSRGYIWVVSNNEGLSRFDGSQVKNYSAANYGLDPNIKAIFEAPDSMIWTVSYLLGQQDKFIQVFDPITERSLSLEEFLGFSPSFQPADIDFVQKNKDGSLWIKTYQSKIYEYNGDSLYLWTSNISTDFNLFYKVNNSYYYGLDDDEDNLVQIAYCSRSNKILYKEELETAKYAFFIGSPAQDQSANSPVFLTYVDKYSDLNTLIRLYPDRSPIRLDSFKSTTFDSYMSDDRYLYKMSFPYVKRYQYDFQLYDSLHIPEGKDPIFVDREKGIWLSSERGKLRRVYNTSSKFKQYKYPIKNATWHTAVRGIAKGIDNDIFLAQGGALVHISKKGKLQYLFTPRKEQEFPDFFGMILEKEGKTIWLADRNKLWNIDPEKLTYRYFIQNKAPELFWQPFEDEKGQIWLGSSRGLYLLNKKEKRIDAFENYGEFSILKEASIFAFHENEKGIWLCSSKGLFLLNNQGEIITRYHSKSPLNPLAHDIITHLFEDQDGSFWLTTKGGGLLHWNPELEINEQFTIENALIDNTIYAVYPDDFNQLWLPSNNGLMAFNKETKEIIHYLVEDGLTHLEFNTISHYKSKDGELFLGGLNGAISFYPKDLSQYDAAPLVLSAFKKVDINDELYQDNIQTVLKDKTIILDPRDKFFELSFALLRFKDIKHHRYAYKIEGYDKNWQQLEIPTLKVNNLPYGNYTLRIRAQAPASPWQELAFPIQIKVPKPFYFQIWFLLSILASVIVLLLALQRWRIARLQKRKEELELLVKERTAEIAKQAEKLKTLDQLKSRFFANISHELRTPLTLILGYVEEIQRKPFGMLDEQKIRKNVKVIEQNGQNLLALIEEILELSKLEAGKVKLQEKAIDFHAFVNRVFGNFEAFAKQKQIDYQLEYKLPKDLMLNVDQNKLEKVLSNLLSNAFKFTNSGKAINMRLQLWENDQIQIIVEDQGMGIDEKDLPHIFERFYQSERPDFNSEGGTGIGLALCKEFLHLMAADFMVESQFGEGSKFIIYLPLKVASEVPEEVPSVETKSTEIQKEEWTSSLAKPTILCVEDNEDMRDFIKSLLEYDYNLITAMNGLEGWEKLQNPDYREKVELIISDAMMPLMDGFTLMHKIKGDDYLRNIPTIMLTARAAEEDKLEALTIGVDDYIIKPFSNQELRIRIQNLLENYKNRKLWKQKLIIAAEHIHQQDTPKKEAILEEKDKEEQHEEISTLDLHWMKEVEAKIFELLQEEDFNIELLAQKMHLSKRQFERKIRKITGLSPAKLVMEVRMQSARKYLEKGSYTSISEVSLAVGIKTPSYFSKLYVNRFGKRPGDYFS
jgi:signal transduction histidine kinase/DNA-binding response OmpR family regulator